MIHTRTQRARATIVFFDVSVVRGRRGELRKQKTRSGSRIQCCNKTLIQNNDPCIVQLHLAQS